MNREILDTLMQTEYKKKKKKLEFRRVSSGRALFLTRYQAGPYVILVLTILAVL